MKSLESTKLGKSRTKGQQEEISRPIHSIKSFWNLQCKQKEALCSLTFFPHRKEKFGRGVYEQGAFALGSWLCGLWRAINFILHFFSAAASHLDEINETNCKGAANDVAFCYLNHLYFPCFDSFKFVPVFSEDNIFFISVSLPKLAIFPQIKGHTICQKNGSQPIVLKEQRRVMLSAIAQWQLLRDPLFIICLTDAI